MRWAPAGRGLHGEVAAPPDKSISHRAALFAAMADEPVTVRNYLESQDTRSTLDALLKLGAAVEEDGPGGILIRGVGLHAPLEATGGLLGVFEKDDYVPAEGVLRSGDALLLFTDGMVETPRRDLADGIDKLQGEAERLVARGFRHGARRLIDAVASSDADDRALILLWRT